MLYFKTITTVIISAIWLLAGCAVHSEHPEPQSNKVFSISTGNVKAQDTIVINLPDKHPSKLSIQDPEGIWHLVHDNDEKVLLMDSAAFERLTSIELDVSKLRGISWINGERLEGRVFNITGEYLIYFADNLETEPDNTFSLSGKVVLEP